MPHSPFSHMIKIENIKMLLANNSLIHVANALRFDREA